MNVVSHQAISIEKEGKFGFLLLEDGSELDVVVVRPEYLSTIIPSGDDVIEPSPDFDPWFSRHGGADAIGETSQMSTNSSLTPLYAFTSQLWSNEPDGLLCEAVPQVKRSLQRKQPGLHRMDIAQ